MMGMETILECVETVLMTGRLQNHNPVSLLLIAAPESGKTSIFAERECKSAITLSDVTGRGLLEMLKYKPEISHFIINDMVGVVSHKQQVNHYTLAIMNAMTEEGIKAIAFPGQVEVYKSGMRGVIAAVTTQLQADGRRWWNLIGFSSRMLPINFYHSDNLVVKIKDSIDSTRGVKQSNTITLNIPDFPVAVKCDKVFNNDIRSIADRKSSEMCEVGYRRLKQFHALVRAHALLRTHSWKGAEVAKDDMDFLLRIYPFISYAKAGAL